MRPELALLLDDPITQRMVLTWPLIAARVNGETITDTAQFWSDVACCSLEEAARRTLTLRALEVVLPDGLVDPDATIHLRRHAMARACALEQNPRLAAAKYLEFLDGVEGDALLAFLRATLPDREF